MMGAGFLARIKEAQNADRLTEEQGQRITRSIAKAIETLFRSGAYTEEMDEPREVRASAFLAPKTQLLAFRREDTRTELKAIDLREIADPVDVGGHEAENSAEGGEAI
jgi:hypothetical protein